MLITHIDAEASRSPLPPKRCDLAPHTGTPTRVVDEADDVGNLFLWLDAALVLIVILTIIYAGALLNNWLFPL